MYYETVIRDMQDFFKENGIVPGEGGVFVGKGKKIRISYRADRKVYECAIADENSDSYKIVSTYLFDETQTERDAESVAIDFVDTLQKELGLTARREAAQVELPDAGRGEKIGFAGLTQKLLAIFPDYKDAYKEHVARYGKLLFIQFAKETFIPAMREVLASGNQKKAKKLFDALGDLLVNCDSEVAPVIVALAAASTYQIENANAVFKEASAECPALYSQALAFQRQLAHNKKLQQTLLKETSC